MKKYISLLLCLILFAGTCLPASALQGTASDSSLPAAIRRFLLSEREQTALTAPADNLADDAAGNGVCTTQMLQKTHYNSADKMEDLLGTTVSRQLTELLHAALQQTKERVDVSALNLTFSEQLHTAILDLIAREFFDIIHFDSVGLSYSTDDYKVLSVSFSYQCSKEQYDRMLVAAKTAAAELLCGIQGNDKLTDIEKALLLHDRLAVHCEYGDVNGDPLYTGNMYAALVLRSAVCQGYSEAYAYLLSCVGIRSEIADSKELYHAWNIVYIDGKPYHVDVTWDDPTPDKAGYVRHLNFLVSTEELRNGAVAHIAYDYDDSPTDTTYDDSFWRNSEAAFVLLDGEIYYIDHQSETLHRMSDRKKLCSVKETWYLNKQGDYILGNCARLGIINNTLFVSMPTALYTFNTATNAFLPLYAPSLSTDKETGYSIGGFHHRNGVFTFNLQLLVNGSIGFFTTTEKYKRGTSFVLGDVDASESVSSSDARLVLRSAVGLESFTVEQKTAADLDFDGSVTSSDARLVLRYAVGLESFYYDITTHAS